MFVNMKELKKHAILGFEIKSDSYRECPRLFDVWNTCQPGEISQLFAMTMTVYTMSECTGWYPGDTRTIHHPEVTYTFTLLKNIWVGARVI